jgi:hypothetical protein
MTDSGHLYIHELASAELPFLLIGQDTFHPDQLTAVLGDPGPAGDDAVPSRPQEVEGTLDCGPAAAEGGARNPADGIAQGIKDSAVYRSQRVPVLLFDFQDAFAVTGLQPGQADPYILGKTGIIDQLRCPLPVLVLYCFFHVNAVSVSKLLMSVTDSL